jgi:hypothetical protein
MRPDATSTRSWLDRLAMVAVIVGLVAVWAASSGCSGGGAGDGEPDATPVCNGSIGCNGECEQGNSWGVGRYCTVGGGECADTPNRLAPFCTVDFEPDAELTMCTRPCADDTQCGENAIWRSESGDDEGSKGCVPMFCLE